MDGCKEISSTELIIDIIDNERMWRMWLCPDYGNAATVSGRSQCRAEIQIP
jgi:hypothetical protein